MRIVAIDPGNTTGIAVYISDPFTFISKQLSAMLALRWIESYILEHSGEWLIVCERFDIDRSTAKKTMFRDALDVSGALRYIAFERHQYELQGRSDALKPGVSATLQRLGWWSRGNVHANDAAAHLSLAMIRHCPVEYMALLDRVQ